MAARLKLKGIGGGAPQREERAFNWINAGKPTGGDGYMKASLKTLPDFPRGGAWPSSVRTARRSVKSDNERDPCPYLLSYPLG